MLKRRSLGEALQAATGNHFEVIQLSQDEYIAALEASGLNHDLTTLYASFQLPIEEGSLAENTNDLPTVLGHDLLPITEAIKEVLSR